MALKQKILDATITCIINSGAENVRVAEIARDVCCATSVLYHYFESRDDLIDEALIQLMSEYNAGLWRQIIEQAETAKSPDDVRRCFQIIPDTIDLEVFRRERSVGVMVVGLATTRARVREEMAAQLEARAQIPLTDAFRKLLEKNLLRSDIGPSTIALAVRMTAYAHTLEDFGSPDGAISEGWRDFYMLMIDTLLTDAA
jgi:AcrR family transcriptional regulator